MPSERRGEVSRTERDIGKRIGDRISDHAITNSSHYTLDLKMQVPLQVLLKTSGKGIWPETMPRVRKQYGIKELTESIRNVSYKVRHYREEAGYSQNELAKRAGVGQSTVNELENGVAADVQLSTLCLLARALKRPVGAFLASSDIELSDPEQELLQRAVDDLGRNFNTIRNISKRLKK